MGADTDLTRETAELITAAKALLIQIGDVYWIKDGKAGSNPVAIRLYDAIDAFEKACE